MSDDALDAEFAAFGGCTRCGAKRCRRGPEGGAATMVKCLFCDAGYVIYPGQMEPRSAHPQPNAQPALSGASPAIYDPVNYPEGASVADAYLAAKEVVQANSAQPPAPEIERGKLVRADDPESREWWRKVHEINDLPSNARLSHAESILRELAAYVAMPVIHGPDVLSLASQAHAFLADGSAHYEWHSESRLKGMRDVVRIAFESVGGGGYSAGRMCERLGITRGEGHRAGIQWLANAMTDLAESDYLAREATDALAVKVARPHQFEAGDYRCKVCGTPWRCHSDGTWSIRTSRLAERCCDNHPGFLLVMEPDPSLPPPTPQPTDRSEAPSSEVSDLVLRIDAILGAEPGVLWARVVRPLLRDLRDELASAAASGSGAEEGQLIAERDELEEFVAACAAAAGCEREWSNLHDHRECVMEACRAFRAYVGAGKMESK